MIYYRLIPIAISKGETKMHIGQRLRKRRHALRIQLACIHFVSYLPEAIMICAVHCGRKVGIPEKWRTEPVAGQRFLRLNL